MKVIRVNEDIVWNTHIPASIDSVFNFLNSDKGRASFWSESAIEKNDAIHFKFINGISCISPILERNPPYLFVLEYMDSIARFELKSDGKHATDLKLINQNVSQDDWLDVYAGWLNVLFPLKAMVCYGVDLRNHDPSRSWKQKFIDQ